MCLPFTQHTTNLVNRNKRGSVSGLPHVCLLFLLLLSGTVEGAPATPQTLGHEDEEGPLEHLMESFDENSDGSLDAHEFEELVKKIGLTEARASGDGHDHNHRRDSIGPRSVVEHDNDDECPSVSHVFETYANESDPSHLLNAGELRDVGPELLKQLAAGCYLEESTLSICERPSRAQAWVAAMGSTLAISLLALVGLTLIPIGREGWEKAEHMAINLLVSLAIGTLLGGAIIHLIPLAFGVHAHGGENASVDPEDVRLKGIMVLLGFFISYVLELCIRMLTGHVHSHVPGSGVHGDVDMAQRVCAYAMDTHPPYATKEADLDRSNQGPWLHDFVVPVGESVNNISSSEQSTERREKSGDNHVSGKGSHGHVLPVGWLNLFADGLHNIIDGLALGAAFSADMDVGWATFLAIALHELPQEIGDYGVLVRAGFSKSRALFYNFLSGCTAILGAIIGTAAGSHEETERYVLGIAGGGFIYIAAVGMVPEILEQKQTLKEAFCNALAMVMGFVIMILIAVYEIGKECRTA